ncbi:MAG: UDP-glucose 4-epimerase GalE [Gammaproteobacteria bacterium]|nr:UDP-glucose 4-epimerase GalE [Gammaproteobacteria bacterium]MBU2058466.1 UDP-glucose 4-epimerase GalE [Gammaproteobacteria bacterium]MBU2176481.1 UDP-glucose 4-epimerase GalE [Gammaproteobacteria bacterium]MBU2248577.1 UDP-glucose 4-epimerase GalE [Gammaproteobacteria bacterium]MBU2345560.1 UDP-glucose 4-epimerase GalE [Gammaproteobacteria bacterium]
MSYVVLTGGAGYIGSHTALALLRAGEQVISFDNYSNSSSESLKRVEQLTGKSIIQIEGDVLDSDALAAVFAQYPVKAVVHFAGLKAVGESTQKPLWYYETNVGGSIKLCQVMAKFGVKNLVFSSSATVYGDAQNSPLPETTPTVAMNPYGKSKLMTEWVLQDLYHSDNSWNIAVLRYFNPVGADESGRIGEDPNGIPNNLMPFITQVAVGKRAELQIFGNDYPTADGTGVRDYIHVTDLALGHVAALQHLFKGQGFGTFNLGSGEGLSVLDIVTRFAAVNQIEVPYKFAARRPGDVARYFADPSKAKAVLNWQTEKTLDDIVRDSWNWQKNNPNGYN